MELTFNDILENINELSLEDQENLIDIIQKRIAEKKRHTLRMEINEAKADYKAGNVRSGSAADIINEALGK